jgi:hypothetical protein
MGKGSFIKLLKFDKACKCDTPNFVLMAQVTLDISSSLADRLRRMFGIVGTERTMERFMDYQLSSLRHEIASMRADVEAFEKSHDMTSQRFLNDFNAGKLDDREDFIIWSALLETLQRREAELKGLG